MFIHTVLFWLRDGLTAPETAQFIAGARSLTTLADVRHGYLGTPAATDREIIDRSYSYALTVVFDDAAAHDAYQVDPVHDRFREECAHLWRQVRIYDAVTLEG